MRTYARILFTLSLGLLIIGTVDTQDAQARSQYEKAMGKLYPELLKKHGTEKSGKKKFDCKICHGKTKKKRNDYAKALEKALGKKKETDADKIKEALEKIAKEKSTIDKAKTYGELIKDGKLPGSDKTD